MRNRRLIVTATAAGLAAVSLWVLVTLPPRARSVDLSGWVDDRSPPTARGVFHVHSDRSDGSASVEDIVVAASAAGLRFVIFTDHGDGTRAPDPPVYRSGVLCIDAVEISTSGGHYIALGLPASPYPLAGQPHAVVEDVRRLGGFGIVAHPGSAKAGLGWTDFGLAYDGIEWLNGDSQWRDETRRALGGAAVRYLLRPSEALAALLDRPGPTLAQWDDSTRRRQVVGLAGVDAHAHLATGLGRDGDDDSFALALPGYERVFRVFSIRVEIERELAGEEAAAADAALVLGGIRAGRVFTAIDMVAAPARFLFEARTGDRRHPMGSRVETAGPVALAVRAAGPPGTRIVLLADGDPVATVTGGALDFSATRPAAYRAEVFVPGAPGAPAIPWIVSNPIYVGRAPTAAPSPTLPGGPSRALDVGAWVLEHDTRSTASIDHLADRVLLDYDLAGPPPTAAAIVFNLRDTVPDALDGVAFDVRADRPTRASVQLRVDDGSRELRWRRSFYADETTATVEMRFADLFPTLPDMPATPDASHATSLLIAVDAIHTPLGLPSRLVIISPRLVGDR